MERTGEIVPTRGIILDIGRATTHKKIILRFFKEGYQTPEIARKTDHTEEACDKYIKAYQKVEKLNKMMKSEENANVLGVGKSLVDEYIRILNEE